MHSLMLAAAVFVTIVTGTASAAASPSLAFDQVFSVRDEPAALHWRASYRSGGAIHHVELWRDRDRRLKRDTDGVLTSYVYRGRDPADYRLELLDRRRRIHTTIDRTNLYRVGGFVDWFDLAHGLRHPRGAYTLARTPDFSARAAPVASCDWYALTQQGATAHICWDKANRLPLAIVTKAGLVWRVNGMTRATIPATTFAFDDAGFIRADANKEMDRD